VANGLEATIGFSSEELALNRQGRVSDRQQAMLTQAKKTVNVFSVFVVVVAVVFIGIGVTVASSSSSELILPVAATVVVVGLIMFLSIRRTVRAAGRVATARIQHAEGPVAHRVVKLHGNVDDPSSMGGVRYEIEVGGERLVVLSEAAMNSFQEGSPYRVHFVREASLHVLLSAEPL
jgi:hypothetical protein